MIGIGKVLDGGDITSSTGIPAVLIYYSTRRLCFLSMVQKRRCTQYNLTVPDFPNFLTSHMSFYRASERQAICFIGIVWHTS